MRGYVIRSESPHDDFRAAAAAAGLSLARTIPAKPLVPYQEAWSNANQSVVLQYIDDANLGIKYFILYGDPTLQAHVMSSLVQDLAYLNREEIIQIAKQLSSPDDRVLSCNRLAVAETNFDPEIFDLLNQFVADEDEVVRTAATRALGCLRWQQARPIFEKLAATDSSEWVRNAARASIADLG